MPTPLSPASSQRLAFAVCLCLAASSAAVAQPSQVIVVRHAERAADPPDDPLLTAEGVQRAELLAQMLSQAGVRGVVATHWRRTQETALPLARRLALTPTVLTIRRGAVAAHIAEVVETVQKMNGVVLVVGHSDTVPGIVAGLSSSRPVKLCDSSFGHLFVVTPQQPAAPALQLKYGKADAAPAADCQ